MVSQVRYPGEVIQKERGQDAGWVSLDNVKLDDWQEVAKCNVESNQSPAVIHVSNFNFNIPSEAKITNIFVEHDYALESSSNPVKIEPPIINLCSKIEKPSHVEASIYPMDRAVIFSTSEFDLTPEEVNSKDFSLTVEFPENSSDDSGVLTLDFIRVKVEYEEKRYIISSGETNAYFPTQEMPLKKAVGDEFKYTISFRNSNGISTEPQKIKINVPDGVELVKYYYKSNKINKLDDYGEEIAQDEFDTDNMVWYPSVRGKGVAHLRIIFKCVSEGTKILNAYNENGGATSNFYVDVYPEGYETKESKFEETTNKWATELEDDEEFQLINQELAIKVDDVFMEFDMPQEKIDNLKEYCIKWIKREIKPKTHFKALDGISFEINKGERVGIIGFNGAGKSTLLKVLAGVYKPTKGKTFINGKVAPLLELGAGFDHNYSGRENVFLNGAILGYSKEFLESKYDEIVEFSELGDFMDIPIKNYSSGMNAKLGFAVATVVNPEILILDEILSVGDVKFQKKSGDKLKSMMGSGTTVLLVSHSTAKIRELCNRAIWLDKGKVLMDGDVDYVCDAYIEAAEKASADELKDLELV